MKKLNYILISLLAIAGFGSFVFGAPPYTLMRTILPEIDNTYDLGTTTRRWQNLNAVNVSSTAGLFGVITSTNAHFLFPPTVSADRVYNSNHQLTDVAYVDRAVSSLGQRFYMLDTASGVSTYKLTTTTPNGTNQSYTANNLVNNQFVMGWISPEDGTPTKLIAGIYDWVFFTNQSGGAGKQNLRLYWTLVERKADNSEIVIATSTMSDILGTSIQSEDIFLNLNSDYTPDTGSRIIGKIYADVSGAGASPSVTLYYEGDYDSHWEIPTNLEILDTLYVPYTGANSNVNLGVYNLTASGLVSTYTTTTKLFVTKEAGISIVVGGSATNPTPISFYANNNFDNYYGGIDMQNNNQFYLVHTNTLALGTPVGVVLNIGSITDERTIQFQDRDGTLAYLDDIIAGGGYWTDNGTALIPATSTRNVSTTGFFSGGFESIFGTATEYLKFSSTTISGDNYPSIYAQSDNGVSNVLVIEENLILKSAINNPYIAFINESSGSSNVFTINDDGLLSLGGFSALTIATSSSGFKEAFIASGSLLGATSEGDKICTIYKNGAGTGVGALKKVGATCGNISTIGANWVGGVTIEVFAETTAGGYYPQALTVIDARPDTIAFYNGTSTRYWQMETLDLGGLGKYPMLAAYSDGFLGNAGAIANSLIIYDKSGDDSMELSFSADDLSSIGQLVYDATLDMFTIQELNGAEAHLVLTGDLAVDGTGTSTFATNVDINGLLDVDRLVVGTATSTFAGDVSISGSFTNKKILFTETEYGGVDNPYIITETQNLLVSDYITLLDTGTGYPGFAFSSSTYENLLYMDSADGVFYFQGEGFNFNNNVIIPTTSCGTLGTDANGAIICNDLAGMFGGTAELEARIAELEKMIKKQSFIEKIINFIKLWTKNLKLN